jgi:hypothetical protein
VYINRRNLAEEIYYGLMGKMENFCLIEQGTHHFHLERLGGGLLLLIRIVRTWAIVDQKQSYIILAIVSGE